ncbi:hypothetical protein DLP3_109 [Stenotrophomonas phage vB_SmaS_DLP_3]|nr:hypothetical protein DLP3_109 [Stenotrophomonas phage vB_SmaS_DLP_3]
MKTLCIANMKDWTVKYFGNVVGEIKAHEELYAQAKAEVKYAYLGDGPITVEEVVVEEPTAINCTGLILGNDQFDMAAYGV